MNCQITADLKRSNSEEAKNEIYSLLNIKLVIKGAKQEYIKSRPLCVTLKRS